LLWGQCKSKRGSTGVHWREGNVVEWSPTTQRSGSKRPKRRDKMAWYFDVSFGIYQT